MPNGTNPVETRQPQSGLPPGFTLDPDQSAPLPEGFTLDPDQKESPQEKMDRIRATARANIAAQDPRLPKPPTALGSFGISGRAEDIIRSDVEFARELGELSKPAGPVTRKAWDITTGHRLPWEPPVGGAQPQQAAPAPALRTTTAKAQRPSPAGAAIPISPSQYAKPGPYVTQLSPEEEAEFEQWVGTQKVKDPTTGQEEPVWRDSPTSDYDMRGFWKAMQSGDPEATRSAQTGHYPDRFKTPYHRSFSNESQYATPDAPKWVKDKETGEEVQQMDKSGKIVFDERIQPLVEKAAQTYHLPERYIRSVISAESDFKVHPPTGAAGERGIMQITPGTARLYKVDYNRLWDPAYNIDNGARILRDLVDSYHGNLRLAALHYNSAKVTEAGRQYADQVMARYGGPEQEELGAVGGPLMPTELQAPGQYGKPTVPSPEEEGSFWGGVKAGLGLEGVKYLHVIHDPEHRFRVQTVLLDKPASKDDMAVPTRHIVPGSGVIDAIRQQRYSEAAGRVLGPLALIMAQMGLFESAVLKGKMPLRIEGPELAPKVGVEAGGAQAPFGKAAEPTPPAGRVPEQQVVRPRTRPEGPEPEKPPRQPAWKTQAEEGRTIPVEETQAEEPTWRTREARQRAMEEEEVKARQEQYERMRGGRRPPAWKTEAQEGRTIDIERTEVPEPTLRPKPERPERPEPLWRQAGTTPTDPSEITGGVEQASIPEHVQEAANSVRRMTPERAKQLLEELFSMVRETPAEAPRLDPTPRQGEPQALEGEAAVRYELSHREYDDLRQIAERRGIDLSSEAGMTAHDAAPRVIDKIIKSMPDEELEGARSFVGARSPLKKQTPPAPKPAAKPAAPKPKTHFETTPVEKVPKGKPAKPSKPKAGGEESFF